MKWDSEASLSIPDSVSEIVDYCKKLAPDNREYFWYIANDDDIRVLRENSLTFIQDDDMLVVWGPTKC